MKQLFLILFMLASAHLAADTSDEDLKCTASFSTGKRKDKLKWHISGQNKRPNVFSELTFKDLKINIHTIDLKFSRNGYFLEGIRSWGDLKSGKVQDSDYLKSGRRDEFSRSYSKATGKSVNDTTILGGKTFVYNSYLSGSLIAGYACMQDRIRMQHGYQTRALDIFQMTIYKIKRKLHHLDSSYRARWEAPLVGFQGTYNATNYLIFRGQYQYFFCVKYKGRGYWNLRQDEHDGSFTQSSNRSKGFGHLISGGVDLNIFKNWNLTFDATYTKLHAKGGHDKTHMKKGSLVKVPFGSATLHSTMWRVGLHYFF